MLAFPNCKINLGLRILRKRADGYHDLSTVFYPVHLKDILEVLPTESTSPQCHVTGIPLAGDPASNLCIKAWQLLKKDFPRLPVIECWLHKIIPTGAGLGGGSSDGAYMLKMLNQHYALGIEKEQLLNYALQLGSDCPFFLQNTPCCAGSRGELLEPVALNLAGYYFTLVYPGIHIPTGWAFQQVTPHEEDATVLSSIIRLSPEQWRNTLINDFEGPIALAHPEIALIKKKLYDAGAVYASMSGSGSSVYGIFKAPSSLQDAFPPHYFLREGIPAALAGSN